MDSTTREDLITGYRPDAGQITMFTTSWCGYCRRLKAQLSRAEIGFHEVNIEDDESAADLVVALNAGNRTVPTVLFADGSAATNPSIAEVTERAAG